MKRLNKWVGGANKHGGLLNAMGKQVSDWVDRLTKE